jgi:NDP-sugar pyrophosphorylase family protein
MLKLIDFIAQFPLPISIDQQDQPWLIIKDIESIIKSYIQTLDSNFKIENGIAIHKTALIENGVTMKPPLIVGANCKIGANAYFRAGVFLSESVKVGPSTEIKSSVIGRESAIAHMNYVGNSLIGSQVNFEAGSIVANHYNERKEKGVKVIFDGIIHDTGLRKFGAIVGDDSKIGANAVLSPGTILKRNSIVKRLELIEQLSENDNL